MRALLVASLLALAVVSTHAFSRTSWQIHFGVDNNLFNPAYDEPFFYDVEYPSLVNTGGFVHGDPRFYSVLDCGTHPSAIIPAGGNCFAIPAANDAGWRDVSAIPTLNNDTIGMIFLSRLCAVDGPGGQDNNHHINHVSPAHGTYNCLGAVDFTFFQTFVVVEPTDQVMQFQISFTEMDDGSRITVYNSQYPTGIIVPGSYVYLGAQGTADLSQYIVTGTNRVLITQMDDCCYNNNLRSGVVEVNSQVIPVNPNVHPDCDYTFVSSSANSGSASADGTCACLQFTDN